MGTSNDDLLVAIKDNIRETKEIKADIASFVSTLNTAIEQISEIKTRCLLLENKNDVLEKEIQFLKRQLRANNIILHKVPEVENNSEEDVLKTVKAVCEAAEINLPESAVNRCLRLGRGSSNRPILLSLNSNLLKEEIMKRKESFFNNKTPISHDRSFEDRQFGRRIFNCLNHLRKIDKSATYFKNKFRCRSILYSMEEVEEMISGSSLSPDNKEISVSKKLKSSTIEKLSDFRFRERFPTNQC